MASDPEREIWGYGSAGWAPCHSGREKDTQYVLQEWDVHSAEGQNGVGS